MNAFFGEHYGTDIDILPIVKASCENLGSTEYLEFGGMGLLPKFSAMMSKFILRSYISLSFIN